MDRHRNRLFDLALRPCGGVVSEDSGILILVGFTLVMFDHEFIGGILILVAIFH